MRLNASVDQAVAVARRIVIRNRFDTVMGRTYRRNRVNTPVLQAVQLGLLPRLPGDDVLAAVARRRCGQAARHAWAILFGRVHTTIAGTRTGVFVVRMKDGWYVF
jgi:hypothetical protein